MQLVVPRAVMIDAMMLAMIWRMVFQVSLLVFMFFLMVYWLYIIPRDVFFSTDLSLQNFISTDYRMIGF